MRKSKGFTLIELMVVISIIALLISILVPALGKIKDTANRMKSSTQIRGIHQGLVTFSQGNGAQEWFAGIDADGKIDDETNAGDEDIPYVDGTGTNAINTESRFAILLGNDFYSPEFLISPSEDNTSIQVYEFLATDPETDTLFDEDNYSYSMLQIDDPDATPGGRLTEWRNTVNSQAPILSDRVIQRQGKTFSATDTTTFASLHSENSWRGNVAYNDGHVEFETDPELSSVKIGDKTQDTDDNLFNNDDSGDDALLIVRGNGSVAATNTVRTDME